MTVFASLSLWVMGLVAAPGAGPSLAGLVKGLSALEIPEPGMMLLFGLSVGVLGISLGRRRKD